MLVIKNLKNTVPWTYAISDLNDEEIVGTFYEKELQRMNRTEFRVEKVKKRKGNKLYVKWKGYHNSFFNCRISMHLKKNFLFSEDVDKNPV